MFTKLILSTLLVVSVGFNVYAQKGTRAGMGPRHEMKMNNWKKELSLTDEQVKKIEEIRTATQSKFQEKHQQITEAHQALMTAVEQIAADDAIKAAHKDLASKMQEMSDMRIDEMLQVRALLTPEQQKKAASLIAKQGQCTDGNCMGMGLGMGIGFGNPDRPCKGKKGGCPFANKQ